jgi:hypothetical protein
VDEASEIPNEEISATAIEELLASKIPEMFPNPE